MLSKSQKQVVALQQCTKSVATRRSLSNHSCHPCASSVCCSATKANGAQEAPSAGPLAKDIAVQTTEPGIRRDFGYPAKYHAGSFPWLLSAERQRIPVDDLDDTPTTCTGSSLTTAAMRCLPLPARRHIAHTLNLRIARAALGQHAIDDLCEGATAALPQIARLLTAASAGDAGASDDLSHIFTAPLLARYRTDLGRLRNDNVHLDLQVRRVNSAQIHQLRTQTGPLEAHNAMDACKRQQQQHQLSSHLDGQQLAGDHMSVLRAGLARQKYQYTSMLGASYAVGAHASPSSQPQAQARSWAAGIWAAASGKAPVRVRVDVELNADMRYQLIGEHKSPTEYDRHRGTSKVIVDDDATRNLILTLESTTAVTSDNTDMQNYGEQPNKEFQWRVADIDYLLSSEQRIQQEFKEAIALDF
ncbi:hypothetical protein GGI26_000399 [Coemansia sp. RSA 1358]|uniref:Uncharacterized protein n=1 Tax=Coemansia umbellata TaxID=1424467 RepID=A0ABQ8PT95_9FUNG|nr:hypothetical protein BX070DRAFT_76382 [Coemansia spiralis]KAJ1995198.1 hypothetical protein EDC05_001036 [Coemansia umbellata]KAJ2625599.1 hypothetical protein GGI26_000399 [Coemansia sp. RSA 1358]